MKFAIEEHPVIKPPTEKNRTRANNHPALPFARERLRNPNPENTIPEIGNSSASIGPRLGELLAMNGSPAEVTMVTETPFPVAPSVTLAGLRENVLLAGMPVTVKVIGVDNVLFSGVAVML